MKVSSNGFLTLVSDGSVCVGLSVGLTVRARRACQQALNARRCRGAHAGERAQGEGVRENKRARDSQTVSPTHRREKRRTDHTQQQWALLYVSHLEEHG
jgi:hypothetical protein